MPELPRSTYRLQLRSGMDFAKAAELVPYLARLGISHLYLSPPFQAARGSTHGYDVVDANRLDPVLGGEAAFEALARTVQRHGMKILLDIVPNHMGVGQDNPWWWDVLKHGRESRYARFFDIDFDRDPEGKLVLPVLGGTLDEVLSRGEIGLDRADGSGEPTLRYVDERFPVSPKSDLPESEPDAPALRRLIEAQPYRLVFWKEGTTRRNYRRFFNIDQLGGLRVEEPEVFEESHRLILDLVARDLVQGLRIDHVDGLTDSKAYLERLRRRCAEVRSGATPFYIVVEKILVGDEQLPEDWPVAGTTGYEFMNEVLGLLVDRPGLDRLEALAGEITGETASYREVLRAAKGQVLEKLFAGELTVLGERVARLLGIGEDAAQAALRELLIAFPVYRTYGGGNSWSATDAGILEQVFAEAGERATPEVQAILNRLERLLAGPQGEARTLVLGLQQLSGPLMAKAAEDTAFYRYPRLLALNEVGGEPDAHGLEPEAFHRLMAHRLERWPGNLLATATHDTKRGEDARTRLAVLSEQPEAWAEAVRGWRQLNAPLRRGSPAIHAKDEYMLYQSLLGAWPAEPAPIDREALGALRERLAGWLRKALREGKERSDWNDPNEAYEGAAQAFLAAILDPDRSRPFLEAFGGFVARLAPIGAADSLVQLVLKLTTPGVPDIYQGTELWDLSLVDPDNRRPVDFAQRQRLLDDDTPPADLAGRWADGAVKARLLALLLAMRARAPDLFAQGAYQALAVEGEKSGHALAFARYHGDATLIVVVGRRLAGLVDGNLRIAPDAWGDGSVVLPPAWHDLVFADVLGSGSTAPRDGRLRLADLLTQLPVALLVNRGRA
ncbi:malto-oligosyltrehalose synthase [Benzoatithermus flavus]|uniref:Malto-oligosyltrehalose synthase n=1 Tax=Benzoatithermus flavus TaxID=3108223 RepID=A0ABU8XZ40_9PROT